MKKIFCGFLLALLMPVSWASEKPRAMFGVVTAENPSPQQGGVIVLAVRPGSPAEARGLQPGDRIESLNGCKVDTREDMRQLLAGLVPGESVEVMYYRAGGQQAMRASVVLAERPARGQGASSSPGNPGAAVGGDRMLRPLVVNPEIREAMRQHRRAVVQQLAVVDGEFSPQFVTEHLQAIRHLARDANPRSRGWMLGEAGEVTLQFRDAEGMLVLHGANKLLSLTVYNASGLLLQTLPLNTPEQRAELPASVTERLRKLR